VTILNATNQQRFAPTIFEILKLEKKKSQRKSPIQQINGKNAIHGYYQTEKN
jgi:hypothetical protein